MFTSHLEPTTPRRYTPPTTPSAEGHVTVSQEPPHKLYWHEYGNPDGEPVMFIHGGPGGGTEPAHAQFFDPKRYRIILFDQRGCGKSVPDVAENLKGAMAENTTARSVEDIETLRNHLGISGKMHVFGGSWGSTLAMAYAQKHPEHVQPGGLVLRGIFFCGKRDLSYFYQGNAATYDESKPFERQDFSNEGTYRAYHSKGKFTIPEELRSENMKEAYAHAWNRYVTMIPKEERGDMIGAYHHYLNDPNLTPEQRLPYAQAWSLWEGVTSYLSQATTPERLSKYEGGKFASAFATIENEYFYRSLRGEDEVLNELLSPKNLDIIAKLNPKIVHGAHDQVCGVFNGRELATELQRRGQSFEYVESVEAGHSMTEKTTYHHLVDFTDRAPRIAGFPEPTVTNVERVSGLQPKSIFMPDGH